MSRLLTTGIPGLDELLGGGLREGTCALLEGIPGVGKTTVGIQFVVAGALAGEAGVIVTFEQFPEQLYADTRAFGWDLRALEEQNLLRVICTSPEVFLDQLGEVGGLVDSLISEIGAKRLLVDSVAHLASLAETSQELRPLVYGMLNGIRRAGLTAIVTKEVETADLQVIPFEEFLVDVVIRLWYQLGHDRYRRRSLEVVKARGQDHSHGQHALVIGNGGATVYPRHEPSAAACPPTVLPDLKLSSGIRGLDEMLGGGIPQGYTVLVAGSAGIGKTSLALHFIGAGAAQGEPGIYVTFEEADCKLWPLARGFGLDLQQCQEVGLVQVKHVCPVRVSPDQLIWELKQDISRLGARRVVIDSLTDMTMAIPEPDRYRETVFLLCDALQEQGVTALLTTEVAELFGQACITSEHVSIIVDGIVLMKYVELESEVQRAISVLKLRGCDHDKGIRRYSIDATGVRIASRFEGAVGVMGGSPSQTPITLSVRSFTEFDETLNREMLEQFTRLHPQARMASLSLPYSPDEARETVRTALESRSTSLSVAPLCLYWMPEMVHSGRLLPLDGYLTAQETGQHMPKLLEPAYHEGKLYALPALALCGVLIYREDLLEECGFSAPPRTWEELVAQARTVVASRADPGLIGYQFPAYRYEGLTTSFLQNLWSNGGDILAGEEVALDSACALQALQFMRDIIHEQKLAPANLITAAHGLDPQADFLAGRVVFLTMLPSVALTARRQGSALQGRVGVAPHPVGPRGTESVTFLGGWHYGIPVGARAPETAAEFIRFMGSYEVQRERSLRGGPLPTIAELYRDPEIVAFNPDYPLLEKLLRTARRREAIPDYNRISGLIQAHLHPVLAGEAEPEAALRELAAAVRAVRAVRGQG
jgi:circadian clock protein KaiC